MSQIYPTEISEPAEENVWLPTQVVEWWYLLYGRGILVGCFQRWVNFRFYQWERSFVTAIASASFQGSLPISGSQGQVKHTNAWFNLLPGKNIDTHLSYPPCDALGLTPMGIPWGATRLELFGSDPDPEHWEDTRVSHPEDWEDTRVFPCKQVFGSLH